MILSVLPLGAIVIALLSTVPAMTDDAPALTLDVREHDGMLEIELVGLSQRARAFRSGCTVGRQRG